MYFKRFFIFLVILLWFIPGQGITQEKVDFNKQSFVEIEHNFGQVQKGEEVSYVFNILNNSKYLWKIEDVRTTCHCTGAKILSQMQEEVNDEENPDRLNEVRPGENLLIKMWIDTSDYEGEIEQVAYVNLKYLDKRKIIKLFMEGEVTKKE